MITQHVVSYGGDITLTRLPAGRAEEYVWLSFVVRGIEPGPGQEEAWRLSDHVTLMWLDGSTAEVVEVVEGGASGIQTMHLFDLVIRDAGYNTLTIRYVESDRVISMENVALPVAPVV